MITASKLRENIYSFLDDVLETGEPLVVQRKGQRLYIVKENLVAKSPPHTPKKAKRSVMVGNPEDFVHIDWSKEWQSGKL